MISGYWNFMEGSRRGRTYCTTAIVVWDDGRITGAASFGLARLRPEPRRAETSSDDNSRSDTS
jgi:hypothetical protein